MIVHVAKREDAAKYVEVDARAAIDAGILARGHDHDFAGKGDGGVSDLVSAGLDTI